MNNIAKFRVGEKVVGISDSGERFLGVIRECKDYSGVMQYDLGRHGTWTEDHLYPDIGKEGRIATVIASVRRLDTWSKGVSPWSVPPNIVEQMRILYSELIPILQEQIDALHALDAEDQPHA